MRESRCRTFSKTEAELVESMLALTMPEEMIAIGRSTCEINGSLANDRFVFFFVLASGPALSLDETAQQVEG